MTTRQEGTTDAAPTPVGPYSQSVRIGNTISVAGQVGVDPATGAVVSDDVGEQTAQTFRNIAAVLETHGAGLGDVIRVDVYLTDVDHFAAMNAVYAEQFERPFPARTTVYVGLPPTVLVEITVLAIVQS
jgi:2-iminobutanoate/2-iminopropanoate deaminase